MGDLSKPTPILYHTVRKSCTNCFSSNNQCNLLVPNHGPWRKQRIWYISIDHDGKLWNSPGGQLGSAIDDYIFNETFLVVVISKWIFENSVQFNHFFNCDSDWNEFLKYKKSGEKLNLHNVLSPYRNESKEILLYVFSLMA